MNPILLAACFLLVFCGHGPRHVSATKARPQTNIAGAFQNAKGKSCEQITKGFDSWGNRDDWVSEFPVAQQHRVLECLGKLAKKQGIE